MYHGHHIREYRYAYGAIEHVTGDSFFLIMLKYNTANVNMFLDELSKEFCDDIFVCDGAECLHKSHAVKIPENIFLQFIPPYTPEMNTIEQVWKEISTSLEILVLGTKLLIIFLTLLTDFCDSIYSLSFDIISHIWQLVESLKRENNI